MQHYSELSHTQNWDAVCRCKHCQFCSQFLQEKRPSEDEMEPSGMSSSCPHGSSDEKSLDLAFIDRLKVAAATAIIKQKPSSLSGKEYAEQLAKRLGEKEERWKVKAKNLERELLRTKQELLLRQCNAPPTTDCDASSFTAPTTAITTTATTRHTESDLAILTPPSSSEDSPHIDLKMALSRNTRFLHALSSLTSCHTCEHRPTQPSSKHMAVIVESVHTTVKFISEDLKRGPGAGVVPQRLAQEALDALMGVVDGKAASEYRQDIIDDVITLVNRVLDAILGNSELCNTFSQRERSYTLLRLAKSPHLLPKILLAILERIETTSASLRSVRHHSNQMDVQLLENSYHLFASMEDIIASIRRSRSVRPGLPREESGSSGSRRMYPARRAGQQPTHETTNAMSSSTCAHRGEERNSNHALNRALPQKTGNTSPLLIDEGFRTNVQERLEDCLLHISQRFPLFAQYVWRLTGLLQGIQVE